MEALAFRYSRPANCSTVLPVTELQMFRVRVETVSALEFGPLYDGALVGSEELAELVRLTVVSCELTIS